MTFEEKFINRNIAELCEEYDKIKGANTNLARITPDYIDGLKPVHRRALYIMYLSDGGKKPMKLESISGDTLGKLHPHSPSSVEDAIVGLAQPWMNNIPLINGIGNFGSSSGDPAGAARYIKASLSNYAYKCFFEDWKDSVVDMKMGYDEKTLEPMYLPARYPNILLNGTLGIGYGQSANIPTFNFKDVVKATIRLMTEPEADIILIPDSPTGCDVIDMDFRQMTNSCSGSYSMRCTYDIDINTNVVTIKSLPYLIPVKAIRERIAVIKEDGGLPELIAMNDHSGLEVDLRLTFKNNMNPYRCMNKLISSVGGLQKTYPINIAVTNDYVCYDYSVKEVLLAWITYRREQKRVVISHKRTTILGEQRTNDVKLFIMDDKHLHETIKIFRSSRNRSHIEERLIERFKDSEIKMDSLQAKALSDMRMHELSSESYAKYVDRKDQLIKDLIDVEELLMKENGIDEVIINELTEGIKLFGEQRRSNIVSRDAELTFNIEGYCIIQLSANGIIRRTRATNIDEELIPESGGGLVARVANDDSFILIGDDGLYTLINVNEISLDEDVQINKFSTSMIKNIVGMVAYNDSSKHCLVTTAFGKIKRFNIQDCKVNGRGKKICIQLDQGDKIVSCHTIGPNTSSDIIIYTNTGLGQRISSSKIPVSRMNNPGKILVKLSEDERINGAFTIKELDQYIFYITKFGRGRMNIMKYIPTRKTKNDELMNLIELGDRDRLLSIICCNKSDKISIHHANGESSVLDMSKFKSTTMASKPVKITDVNCMVSPIIHAVKL